MSKKRSDTELDIPESCFETKAIFWDHPGLDVLKQIHDFIKMTGQPHMWPYHTHTPPAEGSKPVYLDEFGLPDRLVKLGYFAPCPCCTPRHPRFGHGMIAWFPVEGVIRLVGPHCFRSLDQDAHENALIELRQRKQRAADIAYLLRHRFELIDALHVMAETRLVAQALKTFGKELRDTIEKRLNLRLWQSVRHGMMVFKESTELSSRGSIKEITDLVRYGSVNGVEILQPARKDLLLRLDTAIKALRQSLDHDDWDEHVQTTTDKDRHNLAKVISGSIKAGRDIRADIIEQRKFVDHLNINTMRRWGVHPGNQTPLAIVRVGSRLRIGRTEAAMFSIEIPEDLENDLRPILAKPISEIVDSES